MPFSLPLIFSSNKFTCTLITLQIDPSWPKNPTASDNGTCKYIQFNKVVLFIMSNAPFYLSKFGLDWCTQKGVVEHAYDCSHFCHFLLPLISWQSRKVPVFTTAGRFGTCKFIQFNNDIRKKLSGNKKWQKRVILFTSKGDKEKIEWQ